METPQVSIFYKKAKKIDLEMLDSVSEIQHYNPIYSRFFEMDETNYNRIALNHKYHIHDLKTVVDDNDKKVEKDIFIKLQILKYRLFLLLFITIVLKFPLCIHFLK